MPSTAVFGRPAMRGTIAAAACLALLWAGCMPPPPSKGEDGKDHRTNVEVWLVKPRDLVEEVTLPGVVQADLSVRLSAEVGGTVREVRARTGDEVEKGQVLLVIDDADLQDARRQAQAQVKALAARLREVELGAREEQIRQAEVAVEAAEASVQLARTVAERRKKLVEEKVMPQEAYDMAAGQLEQAEAGYRRAREVLSLTRKGAREETKEALRAQIEAARTAVALTESRIAKCVVKSPLAGVVEGRYADPDEFAAPGMPLFEIVRVSPVKLSLGVPERIFTRLSEGDPVEVAFRGLGARVQARIDRLAFSADRMTQTFEVEILLANPARALVTDEASGEEEQKEVLVRPGLIGGIRFGLGVHEKAVAVPVEALVMEGAHLFVYVEKDGAVHARAVRVGMKKEGLLEILEGLAPGDRLVVAGQKYVRDGDEVTVVEEHTGDLPR